MSKICPQCQAQNRDEARFCMSCNTPFRVDTPVRYCPAGKHPMDPGWETCPYCNASGQGDAQASSRPGLPLPPPLPGSQRRATVAEGGTPARLPTVPENDTRPRVPPPPASAAGQGRQRTVFANEPAAESPVVEPGLRRIVAVLVTYTWRADGQIFPVREGRNYVGSATDCEISLTSDPQMSARHSTIVYRGKDYWIDDEKSMNGTLVNGEMIEEKRRLGDHSVIKTGATTWHFVVLQPGAES
jgi:Inner membrane component of T3SS, cytoplasmic domain/Double zinc ribbon